jgi:hypothetical protein
MEAVEGQAEEKVFLTEEVNLLVKEVISYIIITLGYRVYHPKRCLPPPQVRAMELKHCRTGPQEAILA